MKNMSELSNEKVLHDESALISSNDEELATKRRKKEENEAIEV